MSLFSIGLSGLSAAQTALQTTGSNISNVYTPGYNRQLTLLGESSVGANGVQVNDVQRQFNQYITSQLNHANSSASALQAYSTQVNQIDNLLADKDAGLAPLMQNFFSSLEDLAGSPSDPAARQGVIGNADTLTAQYRSFDSYLDDMQSGINGQIRDEVTQINNGAEQMAKLNKEIALAKAKTGEAPNSLLNQRDQLVADLSERIDVSLVIQDGGTYNLTIGNGQPLVAGTQSFALEAVGSAADPSRTVVAYHDAGGNVIELPESAFEEGTLGGLMTFRGETLDKTQNQIGQLALTLAEGFNAQHRLGQDLNGDQGGDFFKIGSPTVFSNENNSSEAVLTAEFSDFTAVTTNDYTVTYTGVDADGNDAYQVTSLDNSRKFDVAAEDGVLSFDGMSLTVSETPDVGDSFQVQPTRNLAGQLENQIRDTAAIAAASLVNVGGSLKVSQVNAQENYELSGETVELEVATVDAGSGTFTLDFPASASVMANDEIVDTTHEFSPGDKVTVDGISFTIEEMPEAGQTLSLGEFDSSSGDNRNALALQNMQDANLVGGKASLNEAYASIVSDVGNRTNVVKVNLTAQTTLSEQLFAVQQSESGVNLDEEAANLIRYQQYYQANAKVIETGSTLLDTILGLR